MRRNRHLPVAFSSRGSRVKRREDLMDERLTLHILGWTVTCVVISCFLLAGLSLPH